MRFFRIPVICVPIVWFLCATNTRVSGRGFLPVDTPAYLLSESGTQRATKPNTNYGN